MLVLSLYLTRPNSQPNDSVCCRTLKTKLLSLELRSRLPRNWTLIESLWWVFCSVTRSPFPQTAVLQHSLRMIHIDCVLDQLPLVSRQEHFAFPRCTYPLTVASVRQRFKERVDIDSYENKPVPQMPE